MDPVKVAPQTDVENPAAASVGDDDVSTYDVIIVGGGPAGMSAALLLARCRRSVLICDAGSPRNACAREMHGYLTRDCIPPAEFLSMAREDLHKYPTVDFRHGCVTEAGRVDSCFYVEMDSGFRGVCRRLLLATGVTDEIPDIEGLAELYGTSVHHCPICDGYEWRDKPVAVYAQGQKGYAAAQELTAWSRDIILLTDGLSDLDESQRAHLALLRIEVDERPVVRLESEGGTLSRIVFRSGPFLKRDALFFSTSHAQRSDLAQRLGCDMDEKGCVWTAEDRISTCVEGVYVAGDASKSAQLVIVAAADGALAAVAINKSLTADYKEAKKAESQ